MASKISFTSLLNPDVGSQDVAHALAVEVQLEISDILWSLETKEMLAGGLTE